MEKAAPGRMSNSLTSFKTPTTPVYISLLFISLIISLTSIIIIFNIVLEIFVYKTCTNSLVS